MDISEHDPLAAVPSEPLPELVQDTTVCCSTCPDDLVELTGLDILTGHMQVHGLYYFNVPPDLDQLQASLALALNRYPAFAGGLLLEGRRLFFARNNTGARFSIYRCDQPLPPPSTGSFTLHTCRLIDPDLPDRPFSGYTPLTSFRVTLFSDNRWSLAVRNVHSVGDGAAFANLLLCWSRLYRGGLPLPGGTYCRRHIAALRACGGQKASEQFSVLPAANFNLATTRLLNRREHASSLVALPPHELETLTRFCKRQSAGTLTSSDVLHAVLWKAFALACGLPGPEPSQLYSAFDLRRVKGLSIPESYIGNAVIERQARLTFGELRRRTVPEIAGFFRSSIKPLDHQEVKRDIGFLQREYEMGQITDDGCFANFVRSSVVDCLLGTGLFINDLRFIRTAGLAFEDTTSWFEAVPSLGFNTAFIYRGGVDGVNIRAIGSRKWLPRFTEVLEQAVHYAL